jgi:predicted LPLAT superfamily acyltransferase
MSEPGGEASGGHWTEEQEAAKSYLQFRLLTGMLRLLPLPLIRIAVFPISFFYFIFSGKRRKESRRFLEMVSAASGKKFSSSYKHFTSFALYVVEKAAAWAGRIEEKQIHYHDDDMDKFIADIEQKRGALLICSHFGNADMLRALADFSRTRASVSFPVFSIVDFTVTEKFNRMLRDINPESENHLVNAGDIGPETVERLEDCLSRGGLIVIIGDRTARAKEAGGLAKDRGDRRFTFPFLGKPAPFPAGPFFLAALLKASVYFVFAVRRGDLSIKGEYDMLVQKADVDFNCPRSQRNARIEALARSFTETLEKQCVKNPYQWYNIYDFWMS